MQIAAFPQIKHLEEFDFSFQPQIDEKIIKELANLNFLEAGKNMLFLGNAVNLREQLWLKPFFCSFLPSLESDGNYRCL